MQLVNVVSYDDVSKRGGDAKRNLAGKLQFFLYVEFELVKLVKGILSFT